MARPAGPKPRLGSNNKKKLPIDAPVAGQLPKPSQGYTLPALAVGLPNQLEHLTKIGLANSRAAQALKKEVSRGDAEARRESPWRTSVR